MKGADTYLADADHEDEDADYGPDEHPPHYPRPGQGLMRTLPPEQEDLSYLVDDDDQYGVFSHVYRADPHAADSGFNMNGLPMSEGAGV